MTSTLWSHRRETGTDQASYLNFTEVVLLKHHRTHTPVKPHCSSYTPMTFSEQVYGKCLIHDSSVVKVSSSSLKWSLVYTPLGRTYNTTPLSFIIE